MVFSPRDLISARGGSIIGAKDGGASYQLRGGLRLRSFSGSRSSPARTRRAPKRAARGWELGRLVVCAIALYALGAIASITHHPVLAGFVYAVGIGVCAFAAWLSRGSDSDDPPGGDQPADEEPPPDPEGMPRFDWAEFERAFRAYADRSDDRARLPLRAAPVDAQQQFVNALFPRDLGVKRDRDDIALPDRDRMAVDARQHLQPRRRARSPTERG